MNTDFSQDQLLPQPWTSNSTYFTLVCHPLQSLHSPRRATFTHPASSSNSIPPPPPPGYYSAPLESINANSVTTASAVVLAGEMEEVCKVLKMWRWLSTLNISTLPEIIKFNGDDRNEATSRFFPNSIFPFSIVWLHLADVRTCSPV